MSALPDPEPSLSFPKITLKFSRTATDFFCVENAYQESIALFTELSEAISYQKELEKSLKTTVSPDYTIFAHQAVFDALPDVSVLTRAGEMEEGVKITKNVDFIKHIMTKMIEAAKGFSADPSADPADQYHERERRQSAWIREPELRRYYDISDAEKYSAVKHSAVSGAVHKDKNPYYVARPAEVDLSVPLTLYVNAEGGPPGKSCNPYYGAILSIHPFKTGEKLPDCKKITYHKTVVAEREDVLDTAAGGRARSRHVGGHSGAAKQISARIGYDNYFGIGTDDIGGGHGRYIDEYEAGFNRFGDGGRGVVGLTDHGSYPNGIESVMLLFAVGLVFVFCACICGLFAGFFGFVVGSGVGWAQKTKEAVNVYDQSDQV